MHHELLKNHFLRNVDLTPGELETITQSFRVEKVARGEYLLRKGEICSMEGYVVEGCFKVYVIDEKGDEKILYFAASDWWVMEIDSFANQTPSDLYIQAITDSTLLLISRNDKEQLYQKNPKVERLFRIMSQKAVAAWQRRLVHNHTMSAEARYHHFVSTYPEIAGMVTNKLIASYLGITQEFLSVIRKRRT
ncbi:MAG: Crp/Fnr family transcriptional regulator [Bacteroidota bacterium]